MPGGPCLFSGPQTSTQSLHFWHSGLHMRTRVPQIRPSSSGCTAGDTTNTERLGGGKILARGGWFNAWTHKITSKKMRGPLSVGDPTSHTGQGHGRNSEKQPKNLKKKKKRNEALSWGIERQEGTEKDLEKMRRNRKQSCQREADWIERRRKRK